MAKRRLLIIGAGKLGGAVLDQLAQFFPDFDYTLASRDRDLTEKRAQLTRYVCSQWGLYPSISAEVADLMDTDRTAALLARTRPDVILNATTPFPWWQIDDLPTPLNERAKKAGAGPWSALDCVLPLQLTRSIAQSGIAATFVNACYPDMVNAFLKGEGSGPSTGVGNLSNLVPGLRIAFARHLGVAVDTVKVRLVAHHATSLNSPMLGAAGSAPFYLSIDSGDDRLIFTAGDDTCLLYTSPSPRD